MHTRTGRGAGWWWRLVAVALVGLAAATAQADVITLTNGQTIRGKIVERRLAEVVVQLPYGQVTLHTSQIASIQEESDFDRLLGEGNELAAQGQYEAAIQEYRKALVLRPDDPGMRDRIILAYRNLARKRIAARDVKGAQETLEDLLRFAPGDEEATRSLAQLHQLRGRVDEMLDQAALLFDIGAYPRAVEEYRRALALAPERAERIRPLLYQAHVEAGNAEFVQRRYPEAALQFLGARRLVETPDREVQKRWAYAVLVPVINQINSGKMSLTSEWETALELVERVAQEAPEVAQVHFVRGLCLEALGEPQRAREAYARITGEAEPGPPTAEAARAAREKAHQRLRQDPIRLTVATKDARWLTVDEGHWQTLTTDHFVIFHRNAYVAEKVARAAEYWYAAIIVHWTAPGTYLPWPRKCSLYLYPTREAMTAATNVPPWVPAVSHVVGRDGQLVDHRLSTYQTVRMLNESILPHELTHIIFPQLIGYPSDLPTWIHECAALLEEPELKRQRFREAVRIYLADRVALDAQRLLSVTGYPPEDEAQRFYAQCHAMAEYLMANGGRTKFLAFAREVAALKEPDRARAAARLLLETYGFKSLEAFDQAWRAFAQRPS